MSDVERQRGLIVAGLEATIEAPESSTTERTRAAIALSEILRDDLASGQAARRDAARLADPRELDRELDETLAGLVLAAAQDETVFERYPRLTRLVFDMAAEAAEGLYRERSAGLRAAADAIVADAAEGSRPVESPPSPDAAVSDRTVIADTEPVEAQPVPFRVPPGVELGAGWHGID